MNLSRWQDYSADDRVRLLSEIGSAVRNHEMPVQRYVLVHPEARLTDMEREQIYKWTRNERSNLQRRQPQSRDLMILHLVPANWLEQKTEYR